MWRSWLLGDPLLAPSGGHAGLRRPARLVNVDPAPSRRVPEFVRRARCASAHRHASRRLCPTRARDARSGPGCRGRSRRGCRLNPHVCEYTRASRQPGPTRPRSGMWRQRHPARLTSTNSGVVVRTIVADELRVIRVRGATSRALRAGRASSRRLIPTRGRTCRSPRPRSLPRCTSPPSAAGSARADHDVARRPRVPRVPEGAEELPGAAIGSGACHARSSLRRRRLPDTILTALAMALGHRACRAGCSVIYTIAGDMLTELRGARADDSVDRSHDPLHRPRPAPRRRRGRASAGADGRTRPAPTSSCVWSAWPPPAWSEHAPLDTRSHHSAWYAHPTAANSAASAASGTVFRQRPGLDSSQPDSFATSTGDM